VVAIIRERTDLSDSIVIGESIVSCKRVRHVMRWWLCRNRHNKGLAMRAGGINEVIQQAYCAILTNCRRDIKCSWTTAVCRQVEWSLLKILRKQDSCRRAESLYCSYEGRRTISTPPEDIMLLERSQAAIRVWLVLKDVACDMGFPPECVDVVRLRMRGVSVAEIAKRSEKSADAIKLQELLVMQYLLSDEARDVFHQFRFLVDPTV
jgi:hypothetical protein